MDVEGEVRAREGIDSVDNSSEVVDEFDSDELSSCGLDHVENGDDAVVVQGETDHDKAA